MRNIGRLIAAFEHDTEWLTVGEISQRTALSKQHCHRGMSKLFDDGIVLLDRETGNGPHLFRLRKDMSSTARRLYDDYMQRYRILKEKVAT